MEQRRRPPSYSYIELIQQPTVTVITSETYEVTTEGSSDEYIVAGKESLMKNEDASVYQNNI
jgi:hypothetical protein